MKPTKKLIQETKTLIQLQHFLRAEVGLREDLSARGLKAILAVLKPVKKA
jgi:hypothetical protein